VKHFVERNKANIIIYIIAALSAISTTRACATFRNSQKLGTKTLNVIPGGHHCILRWETHTRSHFDLALLSDLLGGGRQVSHEPSRKECIGWMPGHLERGKDPCFRRRETVDTVSLSMDLQSGNLIQASFVASPRARSLLSYIRARKKSLPWT
jgi:hypothetical protein